MGLRAGHGSAQGQQLPDEVGRLIQFSAGSGVGAGVPSLRRARSFVRLGVCTFGRSALSGAIPWQLPQRVAVRPGSVWSSFTLGDLRAGMHALATRRSVQSSLLSEIATTHPLT